MKAIQENQGNRAAPTGTLIHGIIQGTAAPAQVEAQEAGRAQEQGQESGMKIHIP